MITSQKSKGKEDAVVEIEAMIEQVRKLPNAKIKANLAEVKRLKTALKNFYAEYKHKVMES